GDELRPTGDLRQQRLRALVEHDRAHQPDRAVETGRRRRPLDGPARRGEVIDVGLETLAHGLARVLPLAGAKSGEARRVALGARRRRAAIGHAAREHRAPALSRYAGGVEDVLHADRYAFEPAGRCTGRASLVRRAREAVCTLLIKPREGVDRGLRAPIARERL